MAAVTPKTLIGESGRYHLRHEFKIIIVTFASGADVLQSVSPCGLLLCRRRGNYDI